MTDSEPHPSAANPASEEVEANLAARPPLTLPMLPPPPPTSDQSDQSDQQSPSPRRQLRPRFSSDPGFRPLLLGWCFWLLASWLTLGMGFHQTPLTWLIYAALTGLMFIWPAWRLSVGAGEAAPTDPPAARAARAVRAVLRDWLSLLLIFQAVIWPHVVIRHVTLADPRALLPPGSWSIEQALWIDAAVAGWSLLAAALTALGCVIGTHAGRVAMMAAVVLLALGEPLLQAALAFAAEQLHVPAPQWTLRISPIEAIYGLTQPTPVLELDPWRSIVAAIGAAAAAAWMVVMLASRRSTEMQIPGAVQDGQKPPTMVQVGDARAN